MSRFTDIILNNKVAIFLGVALFAFFISTLSLASSNNGKKNALKQCEAQYREAITEPHCSVPISALPQENEPVYLKIDAENNYKLWSFAHSTLEWDKTTGETALLCSGAENVLEVSNLQLTKKTCAKGTKFTIAGAQHEAKDLKCKTAITGDSLDTREMCRKGFQGTQLFKLGFAASPSEFVSYIEVCMDTGSSSVLYTRHILPGAAIKSSVTGHEGTWKKGQYFTSKTEMLDIENVFATGTQTARFVHLLGTQELADKYLATYLERGHLTPNGDGIFHTWRHASFFYENVVPQWKDVNGGNWANVEALARDIAVHLQEDLIIIQGTVGVLTLPDKDNKLVEISMHEEGVNVPLWTWKIIKSEKLNAGIAFVTLNNPFETKLENVELPCTNVCTPTGWTDNRFVDFKKGYTICCDPNMIHRMVLHTPDEAAVKTVLTRSMLPTTSLGVAPSGSVGILLAAIVVSLCKLM